MTRRTMAMTTAGAIACVLLGTAAEAQTRTMTNLMNFNGTNGGAPCDLTMSPDGNVYGTTYNGGTSGIGGGWSYGTLYRYDVSSNTMTTLVNFDATTGGNPSSGVTFDNAGNLYGVNRDGGTLGRGTLYRYNLATNSYVVLHNFDGVTDYAPTAAPIIGPDGSLYDVSFFGGNTAVAGGNSGSGRLFRFDLNTNTLTTLVNFNRFDAASGNIAGPSGLVVGPDGNLYGTSAYGGSTAVGGLLGNGTLFRYGLTDNSLTTLVSFNTTTNRGGNLAYLDSDGNIYMDNVGPDVLSRYNLSSGILTTLPISINRSTFDPSLGGPYNPILGGPGPDGYLFGTTSDGGFYGKGELFRYNLADNTTTDLYDFNTAFGWFPENGMTWDGGGNLYGTTYRGGIGGNGMLFRMSGDLTGPLVPGPSAPEPGSLLLIAPLVAGGLAAARRRRRVRPV